MEVRAALHPLPKATSPSTLSSLCLDFGLEPKDSKAGVAEVLPAFGFQLRQLRFREQKGTGQAFLELGAEPELGFGPPPPRLLAPRSSYFHILQHLS